MRKSTSGFTLLELAIVLAIIGLLVGAVVATQDFLKKSNIASSIAKVESMVIAYNEFASQYGHSPGDFTGAERIWGARTTCPPTPGAAIDGTNTCNGDGDRVYSASANPIEYLTSIQHLALAGLIQGSYTGAASDAGHNFSMRAGVNIPQGALNNSGFFYNYISAGTGSTDIWAAAGHTWVFEGKYGFSIHFGAHDPNTFTNAPVLTPEEMYQWDLKVDDAIPSRGRVVSYRKTTPGANVWQNCTTTNNASTTRYNTTFDNVACTVITKVNP